jgi:flagellar biosynthesis protein FliR
MPAEVSVPAGTLLAFLLVLARVGGALVFLPWPGVRGAPDAARAAFAVGFTLALAPCWPVIGDVPPTVAVLAGWVLAEAAVGMAIGVPVAILLESFALAAQVLGLQAGYAYASTIDPNTEADSGVLLVFAQLMGGLLFFALGLDRQILRLFAESIEKVPPGAYRFGPAAAEMLIRLGSRLFSVGVRLALPVVALLLLVDVALALLGRLNQQLQLLSLAFPAKMLTALLILSWVMVVFPRVLGEFSEQAWIAAHGMLGM